MNSPQTAHPVIGAAYEADAYRQLLLDTLLMEPLHGFVDVTDLPELSMADLALVASVKGLPITNPMAAKLALLADVQVEADNANERRAAARDEDFYGSASPQTERERLESEYGMGRTFK